jgi:late competence protein required for DNA uptake (superfamily II DNA/RNA helicase)
MNQIMDWNGHCQRCEAETVFHTMSMFDCALVCKKCFDSESKHPKYSLTSTKKPTCSLREISKPSGSLDESIDEVGS